MKQNRKQKGRLPHDGVCRLLLWGCRILTPFLLYFAAYVADTPTLFPSQVGECLRTFFLAFLFLIAGSFYIERQLTKADPTS